MMTQYNVVFWVNFWNRIRTLGKTNENMEFSE